MLSVLFLSSTAQGLPLVRKVQNEGIAKFWSAGYKCTIEGIKVIDDYNTSVEGADIIVACSTRLTSIISSMDAPGRLLFGGNRLQELMLTSDGQTMFSKFFPSKSTEKGHSILVSGVFNGCNWVEPFVLTKMYRYLMEEDRGAFVGSSGSVSIFQYDNMLIDKVLKVFTPILVSTKYVGIFSIYAKVLKDSIEFLYADPSFETVIYNLFEVTRVPIAECLYSICTKSLKSIPIIDNKFVTNVLVSVYPFPITKEESSSLEFSLREGADKHFWNQGTNNIIGWFTSWGKTLHEARRRVYRTLDFATFPRNVQYRSDIGLKSENAEQVFANLKSWGYLDAT